MNPSPANTDAVEIARQAAGIYYGSYSTQAVDKLAALIEPKLRERDERIKKLQEESENWYQQYKAMKIAGSTDLEDLLADTERKLAAAREDGELLDWLEMHGAAYSDVYLLRYPFPKPHNNDRWCAKVNGSECYSDTLRAVIRAARQTHNEEGKG